MHGNKLFVCNISYSVTEKQLKELFSGYGTVIDIKLFEGKGFGFIEMFSPAEAERARVALSGYNFQGRTLRVDEAHPQKSRDSRDSYQGQGNQIEQSYQSYRGSRAYR